MPKPQHARPRRHYHWKPWAKWLHLSSFTISAILVLLSEQSNYEMLATGHHINPSWFTSTPIGGLVSLFFWYAIFVLAGGVLLTMRDDDRNER